MSVKNQWKGMGNLGADPQLRTTPSGDAVCNFSLAIDEVYYIGEAGSKRKVETTVWMPIVVWGRQAVNCSRYLQKGSKILLEGPIKPREYTDSSGTKHRTFEVIAKEIEFVEKIRSREEAKAVEALQNNTVRA
jgi:single-strand DNA-binding protein